MRTIRGRRAMNFKKGSYMSKVRARKSYIFWNNIINSFNETSNIKDSKTVLDMARKTCNVMWQQMNDRMMFSTERQANWDEESMEVALFDFALTSSLSNQTKKFEKSSKSA
jgi:hypothetical protein